MIVFCTAEFIRQKVKNETMQNIIKKVKTKRCRMNLAVRFKSVFLLFLLPSSFLLHAQDIIALENVPVGKCVWSANSLKDNSTTKSGFVLRLVPPQYVQQSDSIALSTLNLNGSDCMRFCITEVTSTFVFSKKIEQNCLDVSKNTKGLHIICAIEVPAQYGAITQQMVTDLRKVNRTHFSYTHQQLIQKGIILKIPKKRKPLFLKKNEFWATGTFTPYREVFCSSCFPQTIKQLELALQQRGYLFIRPDNHLNQWEYTAIRRFQRRNGLKAGKLSIETLKKLGVGY
ncbi:MAG: hypothetical protein RLZZ292_134 [Bacteroidota bacterium]|jgi:hypothetical protein